MRSCRATYVRRIGRSDITERVAGEIDSAHPEAARLGQPLLGLDQVATRRRCAALLQHFVAERAQALLRQRAPAVELARRGEVIACAVTGRFDQLVLAQALVAELDETRQLLAGRVGARLFLLRALRAVRLACDLGLEHSDARMRGLDRLGELDRGAGITRALIEERRFGARQHDFGHPVYAVACFTAGGIGRQRELVMLERAARHGVAADRADI